MSEERNIVDKMGISFLNEPVSGSGSNAPEGEATASRSIVDWSSRILALWTVLSTLKDLGAADHPVKLDEVAEATGSRADVLLPLEDSLAGSGWIEITERTPFGDDSLKLTEEGIAIAQSGEPEAMLKLGESA